MLFGVAKEPGEPFRLRRQRRPPRGRASFRPAHVLMQAVSPRSKNRSSARPRQFSPVDAANGAVPASIAKASIAPVRMR